MASQYSSPAKRRKFEPPEIGISNIDTSCSSATVHRVVLELSPIKESRKNSSRKYFDGKVTNGKKTVRMVCFSPKLRPKLEAHRAKKTAAALIGCSIKETSNDFELLASKKTTVEASSKEFALPSNLKEIDSSTAVHVESLSEINNTPVNQPITIVGKVIGIESAVKLSSKNHPDGLTKQDCRIADTCGSFRLVLWEDKIDSLTVNKTYKFENVTVRSYNNNKYVSLSQASSVKEVEDIGEVIVPSDSNYKQAFVSQKVIEGEVTGVSSVDSYSSCFSCMGKVKELNQMVGECTKCTMKVKLSRCEKSVAVKMTIESIDGCRRNVTAFSREINSIVTGVDGDDLAMRLQCAPEVYCQQ